MNEQRNLTPHRRTVFEVVRASHDHPTAKTVFQRALKKSPELSFATVYNALKYLTDQGLLHEISFGNDSSKYDAVIKKHHHLICKNCESVTDVFEVDERKAQSALPTKLLGFKVEEFSIQIFGICEMCSRKKKG